MVVLETVHCKRENGNKVKNLRLLIHWFSKKTFT